jgi:hypothetical protein
VILSVIDHSQNPLDSNYYYYYYYLLSENTLSNILHFKFGSTILKHQISEQVNGFKILIVHKSKDTRNIGPQAYYGT